MWFRLDEYRNPLSGLVQLPVPTRLFELDIEPVYYPETGPVGVYQGDNWTYYLVCPD